MTKTSLLALKLLTCFLVPTTTFLLQLGILESQFSKGPQPCQVRPTPQPVCVSLVVLLHRNKLKGKGEVNVKKPL